MKTSYILIFLSSFYIFKTSAIEYIGLITNPQSEVVVKTDKIFNELLLGNSTENLFVETYNEIKNSDYRQYFQFYIKVNLQNKKPSEDEINAMLKSNLDESRIAVGLYLEATGEIDKSLQVLSRETGTIGQIYYGRALITNGKNVSKGIQIIKDQTSSGNHLGNSILGAYFSSIKEYEKANKYLLLANDDKYPYAIYNLGVNYCYGRGVTKNLEQAKSLLLRARALGLKSEAGLLLGDIHVELKNENEAIKYFSESSDFGNHKSSFKLGMLYANIIKDDETLNNAVKYFELAIEGGVLDAYFYLAKLKVVKYNVFGNDEDLIYAKGLASEVMKLDRTLGIRTSALIEEIVKPADKN